MGRSKKGHRLRRSIGGHGDNNEEGAKFEAKPPEQKPAFDDLNETKYGKKHEKLSKLGLRAVELKEIEDDPELAGMLDVRTAHSIPPRAALHLRPTALWLLRRRSGRMTLWATTR